MTTAAKPLAQNIVLGAGYLYFDALDANGNPTGERYLGDTPGFELSVSPTKQEVFSSDGPVAEKLIDVTTQVNRTANITARNISAENLALFLIGAEDTVNQGAGSVTDEAQTAYTGTYIQLGRTSTAPNGVQAVENVVVQDDTDTTTYVDGTDYELDADAGRLYIIPGGGISDGDVLHIDYDTTAVSWGQVTTNNLGAATGLLRFQSANTAGTERDVVIPLCEMSPDGTLAWKSRDTVQEMGFVCSVQTSGELAQVYVNGRAA